MNNNTNLADLKEKQFFDYFSEIPLSKGDEALIFSLGIFMYSDNESVKRNAVETIIAIKPPLSRLRKLIDVFGVENEFINTLTDIQNRITKTKMTKQRRRHEKRDDFSLTNEEWEETKEHFSCRCAYCGEDDKLTYDHFYPFSKGGDFSKGNILPCCHLCNSSKNDKDFREWYPKQSFYDEQREKRIIEYIESNRQMTLF